MEYETKEYFVKIKKLIGCVIKLLEECIEDVYDGMLTEKQKDMLTLIVGRKENVVSVILKLTSILLKLQSLEINNDFVLSEIDVNIINEFLKKYSNT